MTGRFVHFHRVFTILVSCSLPWYDFRALAMQQFLPQMQTPVFQFPSQATALVFLILATQFSLASLKENWEVRGFFSTWSSGNFCHQAQQWQSRCRRGWWQPLERSWGLNVVLAGMGGSLHKALAFWPLGTDPTPHRLQNPFQTAPQPGLMAFIWSKLKIKAESTAAYELWIQETRLLLTVAFSPSKNILQIFSVDLHKGSSLL